MDIDKLSISDIYFYINMCEKTIDKLIKDISIEKEATFSTTYTIGTEYIETENEKQFKKFSKIHNNLMELAKKKILDLKWED